MGNISRKRKGASIVNAELISVEASMPPYTRGHLSDIMGLLVDRRTTLNVPALF